MTKKSTDVTSSNKEKKETKMTYSGLGNVESALGKIGKELFGLERQARSTLDNIHIYLNLPGLIKQPLILNYWGPTGTGKTRLVKEIVNHLGLNNRFISFNLTNSDQFKVVGS